MSAKLEYPFGSSVNSGGSDPTKLPLSGGTMDTSATVIFPQTSGRDSELGAWGLGVENADGYWSTIEPTGIYSHKPNDGDYTYTSSLTGGLLSVINNGYGTTNVDWYGISSTDDGQKNFRLDYNGLNIILGNEFEDGNGDPIPNSNKVGLDTSGVHFPDGTVQGTAYAGLGQYFTIGTDYLTILNSGDPTAYWCTFGSGGVSITDDGDDRGASYGASGVYAYKFHLNKTSVGGVDPDTDIEWSFGVAGAKFLDGTIQTTAGIPEAPDDGYAYIRIDGGWQKLNDYL